MKRQNENLKSKRDLGHNITNEERKRIDIIQKIFKNKQKYI